MRIERVAVFFALAVLTSCQRPVTGREFTGGEIREVHVDPEFVRQGVPIKITFRLDGGVQGNVSYTIANKMFDCVPERLSDGRYQCTHAGVSRTDYTQGETSVIVTAKDRRGNQSMGSTPITLDFDCPTIRSLSVTPPIGSPGTTAIIFVEANEVLNLPPVISRGGMIWEPPVGNGTTWQGDHLVTELDTSSSIDIIVRIADLAGNTSGDCGVDGRVPFSVDRTPPIVAAEKIEVLRDVPGLPAVISAEPGAFADDVGIQEIRVLATSTAGSDLLVATLFPEADGSLVATPITQPIRGRVRIQTVDVAEQTSDSVLVRERWRVSVGMGEAADAAIRTAARYTPAVPRSSSQDNRTRELAVALFNADTESAVSEARVGFSVKGALPTSYRDTEYIAAGYDPKSKSIVAFGGLSDNLEYKDSTLVIRWNELSRAYEHELFQADPGQTPAPRAGTNIAFDDTGCGILFGGFDDVRYFNDVWRVCIDQNFRPTWTAIDDGPSPIGRYTPILWDPVLDRFVISFGASDGGVEYPVMILDPGDRTGPWRWIPMTELPDGLTGNYRSTHAFYYEPKVGGYGLGLGTSFFYLADFWTFSEGEWTYSELPFDLWGRYYFGYAYDLARSSLVVFGDGREVPAEVDDDIWFLADDPRDGSQAWRRIELTPSLVRGNPVLVYDSDREATVLFGGRRYHDLLPVPPDIDVLTSPPSFAMLEADLDLDDARPEGIDALELLIRATGSGDGDSIGPGTTADGGVTVRLYDHLTNLWVEVAVVDTPEAGLPISIPVNVTDNPGRFVSPDGVVPVSVSTRYPATEEVAARLEVDLVDGHLVLSADPQPGAKIVDFHASTDSAVAGHPIELSWTVRDAPQGVEIRAGARTVVATAQLSGTIVDAPAEATTYELIAKNTATGDSRRSIFVDVRPADGAPIILAFAADQAAAPRGGIATLRWTTDRAATVRIFRGETEIHSTTTEAGNGSYDASLPLGTATSTVFRIEASMAGSVDMRTDLVLLANERIAIGPNSVENFSDSIAIFDEQDLFIVDMQEPGYIGAEMWIPTEPLCTTIDTYMYLLDDQLEILGSDDDDGVDRCSRINPLNDQFSLVPAGRYYIQVEEYGNDTPIPAYTLRITTTPIACGNGVLEPSEGCDDGNTVSNDGCSSTCTLEVDDVYNAPADGRVVFPGSIPVAGALGVYQINVAATTVIRADTYVPAASTCTGEDTLIELFAADQITLLARDDDSGVGSCSSLVTALAPGLYYLLVHEYGDNGDLPAYELVLESVTGIIGELEPNGVAGEASALGSLSAGSRTATIAGSIAPSGDEDYYIFNLSTAGSVRVTTFTSLDDRLVCDADTVLTFFNSSLTQLATEDDVNGTCAVLDGISGAIPSMVGLSAGTYYIRVNGYGSSTIPAYYFDVEVQ